MYSGGTSIFLSHQFLETLQTLDTGLGLQVPGDRGDTAMPQTRQIIRRHVSAGDIVDPDIIHIKIIRRHY